MSPRTPPPPPLRSVARPKQARSEASLRRLLDAAESLLDEKRFGEISIAEVAKRARSSVGGFYARFRDKDELLLALHERLVGQFDARLSRLEATLLAPREPASRPAELGALVRPTLHLLWQMQRAHRGTLTGFASRAAENRRLWKAGMAFRSQLITRVTSLLLLAREEFTHPDPELAAGLGVELVLGFLEQSHSKASGAAPMPEGRLLEELERVLLHYLTAPGGT